jgi:hypothetical protein
MIRPVDADDFRVNGDNANDYSNLVENGLIRVTLPLVRIVSSNGRVVDRGFVRDDERAAFLAYLRKL